MVQSTLIATLYVNPLTGNDNAVGSRLLPLKTLTRALKQASSRTIIQLASGTYNAASGEVFPLVIPSGVMVVGNESTKGKGILIAGSGEYASPSFGAQNITLRLLTNAQLLGVTVTNPVVRGTGVWIESTAPTLANNTFTNCGREGVFVSGTAKPAIVDNVFVQNAAGGVVMARNSKGEVLRNVCQKTGFAIAVSDSAAPLVVSNKLWENRTGIVLSREARPVLRNNLMEKNTHGGLVVNGNAIPDLGSTQDPAGNIFLENGEFDLQNATSVELISVGNLLNPTRVNGLVQFIAAMQDSSSQVAVSTEFTDMTGHWAAAFVQALVNKEYISGFGDRTFKPEAPITRAQYAAIIAKTFSLPTSTEVRNFTDVKSDFWAAAAIFRASGMGFISGFPDGTFRPEKNLTRVQAIVSVVNGLKLSGGNPNVLGAYRDRAQIPSYATNAVATATQKLLVVNYPETDEVEPLQDITRAEVAALIYQALVATGQESAIPSPYIVSPDVDVAAFTDLHKHWAEPFIQGLASLDLTNGFADGSYKPDTPITRAQYAALVVKAFQPTPKRPAADFSDVPSDFWAHEAIKQAASAGFVGGFGDRTFRPNQNVSRLQVIVSLVNGLALAAADPNLLNGYDDRNAIPDYARVAVASATQQRIIVKHSNPKQIQPNQEVTRAEVAAMVYQGLVAIKRAPAINSPFIVSP